jgi:hypothetical protein
VSELEELLLEPLHASSGAEMSGRVIIWGNLYVISPQAHGIPPNTEYSIKVPFGQVIVNTNSLSILCLAV